jgi:hypothetical protein
MKKFVFYLCVVILAVTISGCSVAPIRNVNADVSKSSSSANINSSSSASTESSSNANTDVSSGSHIDACTVRLTARAVSDYFNYGFRLSAVYDSAGSTNYGNVAVKWNQGDEMDYFQANYGTFVYMYSDRNKYIYEVIMMTVNQAQSNQEIASLSTKLVTMLDANITYAVAAQCYSGLAESAKTVPNSWASRGIDDANYMAEEFTNTDGKDILGFGALLGDSIS